MALKFNVANGGLVQDTSVPAKIEFNITGELTQTVLEPIGAPVYNRQAFALQFATLVVEDAKVGTFRVEVRSYTTSGGGETTHIAEDVVVASPGTLGLSLTINTANVAADRIVKLFLRHVSGNQSSNISVTLE